MKKRLLLLLVLLLFTIPAFSGNLLFIKPSGQDYVEIGPGDPYYDKMVKVVNSSPEMQQVVLNYERTQLRKKARLVKDMKAQGSSARNIRLVLKNYKIKPLILNLTSNSGGSAMGVKNFVVNTVGGGNTQRRETHNKTPMIKISMNGETVLSGDIPNLVRSIAHETGHAVMANEYRGSFPASTFYGQSHWRNMVSDGGLALAEGWAEMNGPYFSQEKNSLTPVANGNFAFHDNKESLKTYDEMMNTEGVISSVFWDIANTIPNGYDKCLEVFEKSQPANMSAFLSVYKQTFPNDNPEIFKIMTINTLGANVCTDAQKVYSDYKSGGLSKDGYIEWMNDTMQQEWIDLGNPEELKPIEDHGEVKQKEEYILEIIQSDTIRQVPVKNELKDIEFLPKRGR